jgi:hypothetical protein
MFKETATEKLIEYILALPKDEQRTIARKIKKVKAASPKSGQKGMKAFLEYAKTLPTRLPKNYKFNREEANER